MAVADRDLELPGLQAGARIRIDRWGVAHIDAASARDAWFLQGFNAARDRLWQIDLWRKRGLGLLAADFGPGYLTQDRAARLLIYRGDMAREWPHYGPDAEAICTAFCEGINAAIALIDAGDLPLPPEFAQFGTRPAPWQPEEVVRIRSHALSRNAQSEFARMQVTRAAGPALDALRQPLDPPVPPEEFALMPDTDLPADALEVYELATAPVTFSAARLAATLEEAPLWRNLGAGQAVERAEGSNNWAVAPRRTTTGRALMASDPHRAFGTPSLRYLVHLEAPGLSLIGAGEPSSPGIMMGHNGRAAFSLTIFPADQEDLFVLEGDGERYRDGDAWQAMTVIREPVAVKGESDQMVELRFAGPAPVIWQDEGRGLVLALRTVATEPGTAPYMACLASARAITPEGFRAALEGWGAPTVNQIYADTEGRVLWQPSGFIPVRRGWRGVVPVAGSHGFGWDGFLTAADLPGETDPASGFVHSANEMNLAASWDQEARPVGYEWHDDGRAERIAAALGAAPTNVAASCALQTDTHSGHALRLIACLPPRAAAAFAGWDGDQRADSTAALLFETWLTRHLAPALLARVAPELREILSPCEPAAIVQLFEGSLPALAGALDLDTGVDGAALLAETLGAAQAEIAAEHGSAGCWGKAHQARFRPAAAAVTGGPGAVPALPVGGSGTTVMLTDYDPPDFTPRVGASVRMVVDVGAWDESRWINAPGQAGDLQARHGQDLAPIWAAGGYVPMVYGEAAVAAATEATWSLRPAGTTA